MGAEQCRPNGCCTSDEEQLQTKFDVRSCADEHGPSPLEMDQLAKYDGSWHREKDNKKMGQISKAVMMWARRYEHPPSDLRLVGDGKVEMRLIGASHNGTLELGPPARLIWSDGEIWVREDAADLLKQPRS